MRAERKARPKQIYVAYVENITVEFNSNFMNQIRQLMKLTNVSKITIKKFSPGKNIINLS